MTIERAPTRILSIASTMLVLCAYPLLHMGCAPASTESQQFPTTWLTDSSSPAQPLAPQRLAVAEPESPHAAVSSVPTNPAPAEPVAPLLVSPAHPGDPGASAMVADIVRALGDGQPPYTVSTGGIENRSHATQREYQRFVQRLTELLDMQGDPVVRFITAQEAAEYELAGSAYLMTKDGFDVWELHLQLKPVNGTWTIWRPAAPVQVLRQVRPGDPQIVQYVSRTTQ